MATNAHTEVPGGPKGAFPPFNAATFASQLVWLAITFVFLYVMMSKVALPRVGGIIEARAKRVADDLAAAEKFRKESDDALAAYEKALTDARARAQAIAGETRDRQTAESEAQRKRLEDGLNARLAEAEKTIAANKQAAMTNVSGIAVETAKAIVTQLIGAAPTDKAAEAAVADALKR
ncbi:MAG TPA: F0F1 ATP synthase subunit B' [Hyphomonadaceae bacterium]|nr:F0F1 ATP synthase subunit B' [Hyphomonadaceae bacterium]